MIDWYTVMCTLSANSAYCIVFALQAGCSMLGAWGTSVSSKDGMVQVYTYIVM